MRLYIKIFMLLSMTGVLYAQPPITGGEETILLKPLQKICFDGMATRPLLLGQTCNCEWEWLTCHESDVPCYPFEGLQLVYEDHFNDARIVKEPFAPTGPLSYDEQVVYRDWRYGYGHNGANGTKPAETSWDADTLNIDINGGHLDLTARHYSKNYPNFDGNGIFAANYTGGTIMTQDKWGYGAFEIKCRMAEDPGQINQAFWLFGGTPAGCKKEELDIFETFDDVANAQHMYDNHPFIEQKDRRFKTTIYSSVCYQDDKRCERTFHSKVPSGSHLSDWHTFKLYWTPYEVSLYVDGKFYYKMFAYGMGNWITNPVQEGQSCATMSRYAHLIDEIAGTFPGWWPDFLVPKYHVKRMVTYPRAENGTMNLLIQNSVRVKNNGNTNLPQTFTTEYIKVWQFGDCQTDVYKRGLYSNGCDHNQPMVNYHMGKIITYGTDFVLSSANVCDPDENKNYWNERLTAVASEAVILEPGTTIEMGTNFETRLESCQSIDKNSAMPNVGGFLRTANNDLPGSYAGLRDTVINGQYGYYSPDATSEVLLSEQYVSELNAELSPNPAADEITLTTNMFPASYNITGVMGEKVMTGTVDSDKQIIPIGNLSHGCYWLTIRQDDQIKQLRFIKISQP